jgi:hypothetical protein
LTSFCIVRYGEVTLPEAESEPVGEATLVQPELVVPLDVVVEVVVVVVVDWVFRGFLPATALAERTPKRTAAATVRIAARRVRAGR